MTNKERDEILISLVKGLNSLQNTVNEMRTEMKNMATKEEIRKFATKEDLKKFATKEDLKKFATKEDLKKFATKEDLKKFATKEDLKKFATKDEMNARFDEQTALIRSEVVEAIKELSQISYERYIELKERIISNENEIKVIKLAIAN
ncbi:MAG: hypothetical protein ILA02_05040 [Clostridia bacterium]|nr:hypothetical protein [Clostridia bacterium]